MSELSAVKDLAVGDVIQVAGFDDNLTVRSARKINKGVDTGKLQITLVTPDGETEVTGQCERGLKYGAQVWRPRGLDTGQRCATGR
jgi:hypothetical protein